jgi:glycosyltransferase involved in cell wall biosynthesis
MVSETVDANGVKNKHIAFFIPNFGDGGVERNAINLTREYVSRGHSVDIVTFHAEQTMSSEIPEGAGFVDLGSGRTITATMSLRSYLRRVRPDVLISAQAHANVAAVLATKLSFTSTRLVLTERLALQAAWDSAAKRGLKDRMLPFFVRRFYPHANAVVANSAGTADQLAASTGLSRDSIDVIYNPAVWPGVEPAGQDAVDHPWFDSSQVPIICSVGRFTPQKDFATLLNSFAVLRSRVESRLVIVGAGPLLASLERLSEDLGISEDVWFAGYQANPYKFISKSAVLVMSSIYEGFGNVLAEAQALGIPTVSTDCESGPREILLNGEAGRLVPVGDFNAIADAVELSLSRDAATMAMVTEATRQISRFRVETLAGDFLERALR